MRNTDTKLEAVLGFCAGFAVLMMVVADIWSGTAGSLPIVVALSAAMLLLAESVRKFSHHIPQPVPAQRLTYRRNRAIGMRKFR